MKTKLPNAINTIEEAQAFLILLHKNRETFHPEDNAFDIVWETADPTEAECRQLNKLMSDIYNLPCNGGRSINLGFDPCEFLMVISGYATVTN